MICVMICLYARAVVAAAVGGGQFNSVGGLPLRLLLSLLLVLFLCLLLLLLLVVFCSYYACCLMFVAC